MSTIEAPVFAKDMMALLGITHPNTLRMKIKRGEIPPPDVRLSMKTRYWHRSTLERAGLIASKTGDAGTEEQK